MSQSTNPIELPISGSAADDEIELKIESETQKYFKIQGKQLKLIRPLDRDAVLKDVSIRVDLISLIITCSQLNERHSSDSLSLSLLSTNTLVQIETISRGLYN